MLGIKTKWSVLSKYQNRTANQLDPKTEPKNKETVMRVY